MTRLEKAKELNPELTDKEIIKNCPEELLPIIEIQGEECNKIDWDCNVCWNYEYKEGEQS